MVHQNLYKKRIILFILLTILSFFISIYSVININKNIDKHKIIEESIVLSQQVRYYDEVLTMSARMALFQDTLYWNNRYYKNVKKLDEVIAKIKKSMPILTSELEKLNKVNLKLVSLEEQALKNAMQNQYEKARELLFSKEYEKAKDLYKRSLDKSLILLDKEIEKIDSSFQKDILISSLTAIFFVGLILIFAYYIFKYLVNYSKILEEEVQEQVKVSTKKDLLLIEQSKLASLGEMLESIAHQWKQPLSSISTAVSGIKLKKSFDELDDEILEYSLSSISNATTHLSTTIDVFRQFYKEDSTKQFNLKETLTKVQTLLVSKIKNKEIVFLDQSLDYSVVGRENELVQVIINIISNAIEELEKLEDTKLIKIETFQNDEFISLEITDNAGGVDEKILSKVFDYKFSTKKDKSGTGIGLYMSKLIMEKNKGFISVRNKEFEYEGKTQIGACFKLDIKK